MAANSLIDRGWGKAAQLVAVDGEIRQLVEVKLNVVRAEPAPLQIEGYSGATEAEPVIEVKEIKNQDE